ncbi:MAG: transposase IS200-family protein [Chlamydiales bacterium]|jgi:REP element-mobilizing transposase RayT|nr:transposase IS200-family protein [Chlamydiales bacterium]
MTHTYRAHYFHLIWSTKNRQPLIHDEFKSRLYDYIKSIINERKGVVLAIGGMPDHIHLLIGLNKIEQFSELIQAIKGSSSRWVKQNIPKSSLFAWQEGYASFTVSYSQLESVQYYIYNQAEHHSKISFADEFVAFLTRHQIEYHPKYVLD